MDIVDENLVYVPTTRKSTIERLFEEGYQPGMCITMKDAWGTEAEFRVMTKKVSQSGMKGEKA